MLPRSLNHQLPRRPPGQKWPLSKPVTVRERNFPHWFSVINHPHLELGMEPAFPKAHGSLAKGGILEKKKNSGSVGRE